MPFITFQPIQELAGDTIANKVVVVNSEHVRRVRFRDGQFGYKQVSLQLDLDNGESQWVYFAPSAASDEQIHERLRDLMLVLSGTALSDFERPLFSAEEDSASSGADAND